MDFSINSIWRALAAKNSPLLETTPPVLREGIARRVCCSPEFHFCYFRIPKAANSTISKTLYYHSFGHTHHVDELGTKAKNSFGDIRTISGLSVESLSKQYFLFTFTRNPYSRVLSAYLDKIIVGGKIAEKLGMGASTSFYAFLKKLEDGYLYENVHWAPQTSLIPIAKEKLNFTGKVETLESDMAFLIRKLFNAECVIKNRTEGQTGATKRLDEFYGTKEKALVKRLYQSDFENFYPD